MSKDNNKPDIDDVDKLKWDIDDEENSNDFYSDGDEPCELDFSHDYDRY